MRDGFLPFAQPDLGEAEQRVAVVAGDVGGGAVGDAAVDDADDDVLAVSAVAVLSLAVASSPGLPVVLARQVLQGAERPIRLDGDAAAVAGMGALGQAAHVVHEPAVLDDGEGLDSTRSRSGA